MNTQEKTDTVNVPVWRQISGIDPQRENEMSADERDAGIRKLVQEVERRATLEFERADGGSVPEAERTIFWDPLARICLQLGISRTKLSAYSRELTGMRAHEISDRILARRKLESRMKAHIERLAMPELEAMRGKMQQRHMMDLRRQFVTWLRAMRQKEKRAGFAAEMGFANPSRLSRACLLAFGVSVDELEARLVCTLVQKFIGESGMAQDQFKRMREEMQTKHERLKKEGMGLSEGAFAVLKGMIDERERAAV